MDDTRQLLQLLLQHHVECVLVGGYAAVMHGSPTVTSDLDVCFHFHPENIRKLFKALEGVNPCMRAGSGMISLFEYKAERLAQLNNLYMKTDLGQLDLLGSLAGIGSYDEVKKHFIEVTIFGLPCPVLDIDSLIKTKKEVGRPKDLQVVLELEVIREKITSGSTSS